MEGVSRTASGNKFQSLTAITANDCLNAVELYVGTMKSPTMTMRSKTLRGRSRASGIVRYWKQSRSFQRGERRVVDLPWAPVDLCVIVDAVRSVSARTPTTHIGATRRRSHSHSHGPCQYCLTSDPHGNNGN
ncbi:hypothetical protein ACJJTC_014260 [Scirpophaga incertulas]